MKHSTLQLLHLCPNLNSLKSIHARLLIDGSIFSSDLVLNKILRLYSRFGAIDYASKMFDEIHQPNPFHWTALIHGYVENCRYTEACNSFRRLFSESIGPLNFTVSSVLKALARISRVKDGEAVFGFVIKFGFGFDLIVQNALLDLFMRCGKVGVARRVFDEMGDRDIVSWNSMISGYGNNGAVEIARGLFDMMPERNVVSWTSMICGYVKTGNMVEAGVLFETMPEKDLASWNVMVSGYLDAGDLYKARSIFDGMPFHDVRTWNMMISGYCKAGDLESAEELFSNVSIRNEASWAILMDGYIKAGDAEHARYLFDQMPKKNLVSWSTMIGGYARNGQPRKALELFEQFKLKGIKPDEAFVLGIISACSQLGISETAQSIVDNLLESSSFTKLRIVTSLIDMYAKCGSIEKASQVFEMANEKDLLCYSTMITSFGNHGLGQDAIRVFNEMRLANIKPDAITFLGVLSACNHGGLVDEGRTYFKQMTDEFGICPSEKHYACMIDLLGRAGCLREAYDLISNMPIAPTSVIWGALLSACRVHCNVEMAEVAAAELFKIEPHNSGNYILLCNVYAAAKRWDGVANVRGMIRELRVRKNKGSSWIELDCGIHEFVIGDLSHKDSEHMYLTLKLLTNEMKLLGYLMTFKEEELFPVSTPYA